MNYFSTLSKRIGAWLAATLLLAAPAHATDYGLPTNIQDGTILHCFNWTINQVREELTNIAEAGFGAVQLSPLQRDDISSSTVWYDLYRPYDFCFIESGMGTKAELTALCSEAAELGIKVVVDVVFNHVDGATSTPTYYHDSWWNTEGYLRWNGDISYSDRTSITHNQLGGTGGYPDVVSESDSVTARAKAYIEELKACGVKGIRFDAAKHIALPSESCNFWSTVCGVSDMWYYGEILGDPGPSNAVTLMTEYTYYMSVTDDGYSTGVLDGGGVSSGYANWSINEGIDDSKIVYWAESHDTYSNDDGATKNTSVSVIDRAYANVASRNGATALYFSRPSSNVKTSIMCCTKGSTHFTDAVVAEVNKFHNAMVGKADYYTASDGVASITRSNGGAVIVNSSGEGSVSIANGGGYCPEGSYIDRVSGNTFTVTSSTISGTVGSTGVAVIYDTDYTGDTDDDTSDTSATISYTYVITFPSSSNTNSWNPVYCYIWNTSADDDGSNYAGKWPGSQMTYDETTGNWTYTLTTTDTANNLSVIFGNGQDGGGSDKQTDNLSCFNYVTSTTTNISMPVNISSVGYATYTPAYAVDLADETEFKAYTVKADSEGKLTFTQVTTIAAGEGVLLESADGGSLSTTIETTSDVSATANSNNDLVGTLTEITSLASSDDSYNYYILNNGTSGLGFYRANNQTVGAGKAYLQIPISSTAKTFLSIDFGSATAIDGITAEAETTSAVNYNLAGQRVSESYKGVAIVNGKKVIRK